MTGDWGYGTVQKSSQLANFKEINWPNITQNPLLMKEIMEKRTYLSVISLNV
jgi:hypothetical protein